MGINFGVDQITSMVTSVLYSEQHSLGILVLLLFLVISGGTAVSRDAIYSLRCEAFVVLVVQSPSRVLLFTNPWTACSMSGFPLLYYLPEFAQVHIH